MKRLVTAGVFLVVAVELIALLAPDRRLVLWASGAAVALALFGIRRSLANRGGPVWDEPTSNDREESLRRWLSQTETLIRWSESSRTDWDRHLRLRLAREFQGAIGHRHSKDPAALQATGRMLFGEELWAWVDSENVARTGGSEPGPGRSALDDILRRLEQL